MPEIYANTPVFFVEVWVDGLEHKALLFVEGASLTIAWGFDTNGAPSLGHYFSLQLVDEKTAHSLAASLAANAHPMQVPIEIV